MVVSFLDGGYHSNWMITTDLSQFNEKLYHILVFEYNSPKRPFELTTLVVIGTDCIGNCKSNYHDHNDPPLCMVVKICQQICDNKTPVTQTKLI